jgi:hypothetical protein
VTQKDSNCFSKFGDFYFYFAGPPTTSLSHLHHTLLRERERERERLQAGNCKAHLMTAPQIPQCNNKKFGACLAFPPIHMWQFGMQTLVRCATCHKHSSASSSSPNLHVKKNLFFVVTIVQNLGFPRTQIGCLHLLLTRQSRV